MRQNLRRAQILVLSFVLAAPVFGQGGPPMITDDPGTPGSGRWEINLATAFEHRAGGSSFDVPAIDLNYGIGNHLQLTLQTAPVILQRPDHGVVGGLGGTEAALKWRWLDEESSGIDLSIFPRVIFSVLQSSVSRGLSEAGTRVQCPMQIAKKFGAVGLDLEAGPVASTEGRAEFLYGVVAGIAVTKATVMMMELRGTARMNFDQDALALNLGVRQVLGPRQIFIASLGHEIRSPAGEALALIGYCGVQFLY